MYFTGAPKGVSVVTSREERRNQMVEQSQYLKVESPIAGELVYNCVRCGASVKHPYPNIWSALDDAATGRIRNLWHQCNESVVGSTHLIGANLTQ